jgi:hypothetical protein
VNSLVKSLFGTALAVVLAACAGTGEAPGSQKSVEEILAGKNLRVVGELDKLVNFNINSWQYVDRQNVVLRDGVKKYYLVELKNPCREMEFAQRIGFTSFGKVVNKFDFIVVTETPGRVVRCMIETFYELERTGK